MPHIRVNPPLLRGESSHLASTGEIVGRLGHDVWNSASGAPSYDGQFGSRVHSIGSEAISRAQAIASRYAGLAGSLNTTANAFEAADSTGISGFRQLAVPPGWRKQLALLQLYALAGALPLYLVTIYLRLATLLGRNVWERRLIYALITRSNAHSFWLGMTFRGIPVAATLDTLILAILAYLRRFVGTSAGPTVPPDGALYSPPVDNGVQPDPLALARTYHINQFQAELLVGGDGSNANCGPTSLTMALHALGLKANGENSSSNNGQTIDLARRVMVADESRDGIDQHGLRVEAEHSKYTNLAEIRRGASASGAITANIDATPDSIRTAIVRGDKVVVSGTFTGKQLENVWTGDRGHDNKTAPGGATEHVIAVTGYDSDSGMFVVNDPARKDPMLVSSSRLAEFMRGNAGAVSIGNPGS